MNELLYTSPSEQAVEFFKENDDMFQQVQLNIENKLQYHDGFRKQMEQWSSNPLDVIIQEIDKNPKYHGGYSKPNSINVKSYMRFRMRRRKIT